MSSQALKPMLVAPLRSVLRVSARLRESVRRIYFHADLAAQLHQELPPSVVVLGRARVYGSGDIRFGRNALLYPELHLETQLPASIILGDGVVLSRGVHLVAMSEISIGDGCMIGEYTSLRDANHLRSPDRALRDSGHTAQPIRLGKEVWVGRGVTILGGVTVGDYATIGANAVVTRDVAPGSVVGGIPATVLHKAGS